MYGGATQDFHAAVDRLSVLPIADNGECAWSCLSAVQSIASAAKRPGYGEIGSSVHELLFDAIEAKIPSMPQ